MVVVVVVAVVRNVERLKEESIFALTSLRE